MHTADFAYRVQSVAQEASGDLVESTVVDVAREFCRLSRAWHYDAVATVTADDINVTLTPGTEIPADTVVVDVLSGLIDDTYPLEKRTVVQLDREISDWRTKAGDPYFVALAETSNALFLARKPSVTYTDGLRLRLILQPAYGAVTLDDDFLNRFGDTLILGAQARILRLPRRPWTDYKLSSYNEERYQEQLSDARSRAVDGHMVGVPRSVRYGGL